MFIYVYVCVREGVCIHENNTLIITIRTLFNSHTSILNIYLIIKVCRIIQLKYTLKRMPNNTHTYTHTHTHAHTHIYIYI